VDKLVAHVAAPQQVNNTDSSIAYAGTWSLNSNRGFGDYNDDVHFTQTSGDSFTYTFSGTGVEFVGEKDAVLGEMDIYVDNVLKQTVNAYNPTRLVQQTLYSISGLPSGTHTIKAVKKNGTYMILDKFNVTGGPKLQYNNTDPGITYTGAWSLSGNRGFGDYNNDVHFTQTNNDSFQFTFTGTGIEWITEKAADQGNVDIYVDNVLQQTVNTSNPTRLTQQSVFSVSGLPAGTHTFKAVKKSGTYMLTDALIVTP
jgi:alpha-galactosidase